MKYCIIVLLTIFSLNIWCQTSNSPTYTAPKYKKVLDIEAGLVEDTFCDRNCPKYPGGGEAIMKSIYSQLGFSDNKDYSQDFTTVRFLITSSGKVKDVTIVKSGNEEYDREIIKAVSALPQFLPFRDSTSYFYCWLSIYFPKEVK